MIVFRFFRMMALILIATVLGNQFAYASKPTDPAAMKAKVEARGVGQGVRVVLADKTEQKGLIVSIGETSFLVKPKGAAEPVEVSYARVTGVHRDKLSTGAKVAITAAIVGGAIGIVAIVLTIKLKHDFGKI